MCLRVLFLKTFNNLGNSIPYDEDGRPSVSCPNQFVCVAVLFSSPLAAGATVPAKRTIESRTAAPSQDLAFFYAFIPKISFLFI